MRWANDREREKDVLDTDEDYLDLQLLSLQHAAPWVKLEYFWSWRLVEPLPDCWYQSLRQGVCGQSPLLPCCSMTSQGTAWTDSLGYSLYCGNVHPSSCSASSLPMLLALILVPGMLSIFWLLKACAILFLTRPYDTRPLLSDWCWSIHEWITIVYRVQICSTWYNNTVHSAQQESLHSLVNSAIDDLYKTILRQKSPVTHSEQLE